ncbi:acyl-coenzyme A thioesterase 9, mitochondrial-like [Condylostylus longicornis]|uniref:acyl-coenzyme A thioesterase 9, mitochondrial-like n=1 Tax=Condylostylus longicornis TaxID=2530218 RepID=UPI00244DD4C6|nr:acyl-coenzyme A thioesterase 9, mitochondrial-like [Condylostylus longicornis]
MFRTTILKLRIELMKPYLFSRHSSTGGRFPTYIDRNVKIMTMKEIKGSIMTRLGLDSTYTPHPKTRDHLSQYEPKLEDLPPRSMNDSFTSALIPLTKDNVLSDSYVTSSQSVRFGRLMEDMDLFAVWVCHKHLYIPKLDPKINLPYTFVTILVDKINFTDVVPSIHNDIRISGHVSWVGTSSIEVVVWLETVKPDGSLEKITKSLFLMAARNATNTKAAPVNPLKADNEYELQILESGKERKNRRSKERESSLLKVLPTQEEQKLMHDNFILTQPNTDIFSGERILPPDCFWMDKTRIVDIDIAFPENRNAHNKIFGGFLMRKAFENSIINSSLYAGLVPRIKCISNIIFHKPVDVNSILKMTTFVTYTEGRNIQVVCITETRTVNTNFSVTNVFHYTYASDINVPKVLPKTYQDSIWNLIGRREFLYYKNLSKV